MTESVMDTRQDTADYDDPPPMRRGMPVTIVEDDTRPELAVVASFNEYVLAGTEQPFRLLAQDRRRKKATVLVNNNPATNPTNNPSWMPPTVAAAPGPYSPVIDTQQFGDDVTGMVFIFNATAVTATAVQMQLQDSDDGVTWFGFQSSNTISAVGTMRIATNGPTARYVRIVVQQMTAGQATISAGYDIKTSSIDSQFPAAIRLGRQQQVSNNQGVLIYAGNTFTYEAESEVWAMPQGGVGGGVVIGVVEERRTPRD